MRSSADRSGAPEQAGGASPIAQLLTLLSPGLVLLASRCGRDSMLVEDAPPGSKLAGGRMPLLPGLLRQEPALLTCVEARMPLAWTVACGTRPAFLASHPVPGTDLHIVLASEDEPDMERLASAAAVAGQLLQAGQSTAAEREASGRINALVRNLPFPLVFADSKGLDVYANEQAEALLGVGPGASRATRIAAALARLLGGSGDDRLQRQMRANPLASLAFDVSHEGKDYKATSRWIDDEMLAGRIWMFSDVTAEKQLQRKLEEMAIRDSLTGMLNRRAFDDRLAQEIARAEREGAPLSLLALDLDHFKSVNDGYGHQAGDAVLKEACRRAAGAVRESDVLARIGGEEFAVLLPMTPCAGAEDAAERIRAAIAAAPVVHEGIAIPVTCSLGVAQYRGVAGADGKGGTALLAAADAALYEAKRSGRNRFVSAPA